MLLDRKFIWVREVSRKNRLQACFTVPSYLAKSDMERKFSSSNSEMDCLREGSLRLRSLLGGCSLEDLGRCSRLSGRNDAIGQCHWSCKFLFFLEGGALFLLCSLWEHCLNTPPQAFYIHQCPRSCRLAEAGLLTHSHTYVTLTYVCVSD